jgi:glycosyltransferase involved in cell wall biosynthesis
MRILIVIHSLQLGGAERSVVNLTKQWHKNGHSVLVVTLDAASVDYFTLEGSAERIALGLARNSENSFHRLIMNFQRIRSLRKILIAWKPEIVVGMMTASAVLSILASFGLSCRTIAAERVYPPSVKLNRMLEWFRSKTYRYAEAILMQTSDGADWIKDNLKYKRVAVIPNSVSSPLPELQPILSPELLAKKSDKILLSVGRLVDQKDHTLLIEACEPLFSEYPDWKLVIIGEGPERQKLEQLIQKKNLQQHILLPGHAGNMSSWYTRAEIYVLTSHFEGFPNSLIEAMAHECAVVSLDIKTGPSDLIEHGVNGLLVSDRDPRTLNAILAGLMGNENERMRLSRSAKSSCSSFSPEYIAKRWEDLFAQISNVN